MRIALVTHEPYYPPSGGGSAAAVYLVRELVRRGHQVEVFGPDIPERESVEAAHSVRLRPFTGWAMGRTTPLRTPKYLAYPAAIARVVRTAVARGAKYDVLVAQHAISCVAAGRLRKALGVPVVFNLLDCLTGFMETWPPYLMPRPVARRMVRYELSLPRRYGVERVLAVSDPLRDRVIATGYPAENVRAVYYGFDSSLFRPEPRPPGDGETPLVVMHGSFDHHHLGRIALDALLAVHRANPRARFRFVGPRTPALRKFLGEVRRHAPAMPLHDTGFVPYERVPDLLREAALGITPYEPSTGTHCAFVAKTVEYLALGLPVVCTPLESAMRYYGGHEGITFSEADGPSFAREILAWLGRPAGERARAVEPLRRKVTEELDWSAVCRRSAEVIESARIRA